MEIVIQLHEYVKFQIVVSRPIFLDLYWNNVDRFLVGVESNANIPSDALGLQDNSPVAVSGHEIESNSSMEANIFEELLAEASTEHDKGWDNFRVSILS
jgi:hypothetical protein